MKDSKRFPDTGGWDTPSFTGTTASNTFTPNTSLQGTMPSAGSRAIELAAARDYIFTSYGKR